MSGECSQLMNCNLQRFIHNNAWTKHLMIFLSVYIFTFILNWYTIESILEEKFSNNIENNNDTKNKNYSGITNDTENKKTNINSTQKYLLKSFYYSIFIYLIFLFSTKNEGIYAFIFLFSSIFIVMGTIYCKSIHSDIYLELDNNFYIYKDFKNRLLQKYENNKKQVEKIVFLQNAIFCIFVVLVLILLFGSYKYYQRQSIQHQKNWSWLIFWFGYKDNCF